MIPIHIIFSFGFLTALLSSAASGMNAEVAVAASGKHTEFAVAAAHGAGGGLAAGSARLAAGHSPQASLVSPADTMGTVPPPQLTYPSDAASGVSVTT
ncbi:MAG: hypothetical protein ABR545_12560, partial [Cyclonatronaceae bacterium]